MTLTDSQVRKIETTLRKIQSSANNKTYNQVRIIILEMNKAKRRTSQITK